MGWRSRHVFPSPDVLGSVLRKPGHRNGIFVVQGLRHNLPEEQNPPSRGVGEDGCPRSMAWKHCCASSLPDMESHLQAFSFKTEKEEVRTTGQLLYTIQQRVHQGQQALATLQRTEAPDDTELQQPFVSPQEDQDWDWSQWNSQELMDWGRPL